MSYDPTLSCPDCGDYITGGQSCACFATYDESKVKNEVMSKMTFFA